MGGSLVRLQRVVLPPFVTSCRVTGIGGLKESVKTANGLFQSGECAINKYFVELEISSECVGGVSCEAHYIVQVRQRPAVRLCGKNDIYRLKLRIVRLEFHSLLPVHRTFCSAV